MSPFDRLGLVLTDEVIALLDEACPHRCPSPSQSDREIWMDAGARRLVDVLKAKHEAAKGDPLQKVL